MPRPSLLTAASAALETILVVAASTAVAAAADLVAPRAGLAIVYLPGVLAVAIRRGGNAALGAALLATLALNYFFTPPIHRLAIRSSENVVALGVFLLVAVVVGRLATSARDGRAEAESRARVAAAREAESEMLADVAALLLGGDPLPDHLDEIGARVGRALGSGPVRLELASAPGHTTDERAVRLPLAHARGWAYLPAGDEDDEQGEAAVQRVLAAVGAVLDVAAERDRVAAAVADAEAARRADVAKTAVLHAISHDLRSPLTAISTAAAGLAAPDLGHDDHQDLVELVRDESARLGRLVDDLLDLSRIQAGAVDPRLDWLDLRDVVASAAVHVRPAEVRIELEDGLPLVRGDAAQLERVFANLLDNAARHSPPGRPVRVRGGVSADQVTVRVIDEGPGVPAARRREIFEPFARSGPRAGSGLGLAIARGFAEAGGGRIRLQEDGAAGATFAVSLPLVSQPATAR